MVPLQDPPDLIFEKSLWDAGIGLVAGLDEAGRGAWAGPVAAAAVILCIDHALPKHLSGVRDSKQMTPRQRACWADRIKSIARAWSVGLASNTEIDDLGIVAATRLSMQRALAGLPVTPQHLLLDALSLPDEDIPQTILIKGDQRSLTIASASILAKTTRDELMIELENQHPGYGLARHKGYGTAVHHLALQHIGPCPFHRVTFRPVKELTKDEHPLPLQRQTPDSLSGNSHQ